MTKRMLIDATHAEETRVVVLDGTRLEDFDVETSTKRQLKGNIYLAKVVRVEPSLQAAFVEYGGNRHGFLAFSEIHPDYYQIPVADRQRLIEMQAEDARREEEEDDLELALSQPQDDPDPVPQMPVPRIPVSQMSGGDTTPAPEPEAWASAATPSLLAAEPVAEPVARVSADGAEAWAKPVTPPLTTNSASSRAVQPLTIRTERVVEDVVSREVMHSSENGHSLHDGASLPNGVSAEDGALAEDGPSGRSSDSDDGETYDASGALIEALPPPESVGGGDHDSGEDHRERRVPPRFLRNYKIQEVIRRRQILLVQVVKEERGTKGAALTTYLSLAGRFGVLMPNSPRGGGISRKITSATDRRRLKEVMQELDIPRGMGMIVRTAGANRPKPEIKRDCEYLLRLWDDIRECTMKSVAPSLIYEEASLIKRAIRDVYSRDIDEILVDGEDGWRAAHDFMRMLMPSHAKKVQLWRDGGQPLFARNQVEAQLDGMLMPTVQLRSGGYLVINQAEALVAIDVNSGRATRERNIEETALRTNLEAADEVARQLRLRDLAGLIVIDFIDMESKRHNAMVERRIKEALKNDRARIQVGHISHFGLLEMSRQRLRPSLAETSFIPCPHCGGTGHVRSTENAAIHVLRGIEDEGGKRRSAEIIVHVSTPVALYLLNHKRERIREIEIRYTMRVIIAADDEQIAPQFRIEKVRTRSADEMPAIVAVEQAVIPMPIEETEDEEEEVEAAGMDDEDDEEEASEDQAADAAGEEQAAGATGDEAERRRKRRRRRRRGGRRDEQQPMAAAAQPDGISTPDEVPETAEVSAKPAEAGEPTETERVAVVVDAEAGEPAGEEQVGGDPAEPGAAAMAGDEDPRNRRRGRRGGRRRRRENEGEMSPFAVPGADQPELQPVYAGPTPADPFGGRVFDIFDVMDQAERAAESQPTLRAASAAEILADTTTQAAEPEGVLADAGAPGRNQREAMPTAAEQVSALMPEPERPAVVEPAIANAATPEQEVETVRSAAAEPEPATAKAAAAKPEMASASALAAISEMATADKAAEPEVNTASAAAAEPEMATANAAAAEPEMAVAQGAAAESAGQAEIHAAAAEPAHSPVPANDTMAEIAIPEPPPPEPLIKPILVGADGEPPGEKKRGWWRR